MKYDAIIFDSDGVLVEPTGHDVHRDAVREAFSEFDVTDVPADTVERLIEISGDDRDRLSAANVERVCRDHGIDPHEYWERRESLAAAAQRDEVRNGRKRLYPDADVLHGLDCSMAVVSNNQDETVAHILTEYDLADHFDIVYGRPPSLDGIRRRKPNTHYAERAIEEIGAERPLFVGDSVVDIRTARQLGIDAVFVRRRHREEYQVTESVDYEVTSLEPLAEIVSSA